MKRNTINLIITSLLGAIILSGILIFKFENIFENIKRPLVTHIFGIEDYEYSISIPDYWEKFSTNDNTVIYTGNNSEYLTLEINELPEPYSRELYGTYAALEIKDKYGGNQPEFLSEEVNDKYIHKIIFSSGTTNYVVGYVENGDFLIDFEYRMSTLNDINENLDNIITSIERYEIKEVDLDGNVIEE